MAQLVRLKNIYDRRVALSAAAVSLNTSLSSPLGDISRWIDKVSGSLETMVKQLAIESEALEGSDGLLSVIEENFPFLSRRVVHHRVDLERLQRHSGALCETILDTSNFDDLESAKVFRFQVVEFLGQLSLYNQRDADLIYDAYTLDVTEFNVLSPVRQVAKL